MRAGTWNAAIGLVAALMSIGCGGGGGSSGGSVAATLSGVFPASVFTSRTYELEVSGVATAWTAASPPAVDLGPGLTIEHLLVASPTALVIDVEVEDDAPTGVRTVTVGGLPFAGFSVEPPFELVVEDGRFDQGSIVRAHFVELDPETPFDLESRPVVGDPASVWGIGANVFIDRFDVDLFVDPAAAPGSFDLVLDDASEVPLLRRRYKLVGAGSVTARAPLTTLPSSVSITGPESGLHRYEAGPVPALVRFPFSSTGPTAVAPLVFRDEFSPFKQEFHAGDATPGPVTITKSGDVRWIAVRVNEGDSAAYTLGTPVVTPYPTVAETEPNGSDATAQPLVAPVIVLDGQISSDTDADWYRLTVAPGDVGKRLRVVTSTDSVFAPAVVVRRADLVTQLGASPFGGTLSDFLTSPLPAAETVYLRVTISPFFYPGPYHLHVAIE